MISRDIDERTLKREDMQKILAEIFDFLHSGRRIDYDEMKVTYQTVRGWMRYRQSDGSFAFASRGPNREKLLRVEEYLRSRRSGVRRSKVDLYQELLERMDLDFPEGAYVQRLCGEYDCFRLTRHNGTEQGIVVGKIDIFASRNGKSLDFHHRSEQKTSGLLEAAGVINFEHQGHVIVAENRLYLLGIGHDGRHCYIRPMILRKADPNRKPLVGMLLTEFMSNVPVAFKTVLLKNGMTDYEKHKNAIRTLLKNEMNDENIIGGWWAGI